VPGTLLVAAVLVLGGVVFGWRVLRSRRLFSTVDERAAYETLHLAALAAPGLRGGLTEQAARSAVHHLRDLLGTPALAVCSEDRLLAWDGDGADHAPNAPAHAALALDHSRVHVLGPDRVRCADPACPLRAAVVAPLQVADVTVGALVAYTTRVSPGLVRATSEVARWASGQLELGELDESRTRLIRAELAALRSQISPHFVYNALTAIASFVNSDPDRARELLLAFADFTRYTLRHDADFTTLADELRSIDKYLELERARFGSRLQVNVQVAPEVLAVAVPFLCVQPLVENAVRHGLEGRPEGGSIRVRALDRGPDAVISVEDDGVGMEPDRARAVLAGDVPEAIGLANVDSRLRQVFGEEFGLTVETGVGLGTSVSLRVPKYRAGVKAA
jgi:two-component system LytT family sensor kinase